MLEFDSSYYCSIRYDVAGLYLWIFKCIPGDWVVTRTIDMENRLQNNWWLRMKSVFMEIMNSWKATVIPN